MSCLLKKVIPVVVNHRHLSIRRVGQPNLFGLLHLFLLLLLLLAPQLAGADVSSATASVPSGDEAGSFFAELVRQPIFVLFGVIVTGLLIGQIKVAGVSLGTSGVLFMALLAGHFQLPMLQGVGKLGLVLFVYCVGLSAGPTFFSTFKRQGKKFVLLSLIIVGSGAMCTLVAAVLYGIPHDLAGGLFAGALTSTPGLAAGLEVAGAESRMAVGYGIAYPFGVIGVVLLVQLLPRLFGKDLESLGVEAQALERASTRGEIERTLVQVVNPVIIGRAPSQVSFLESTNAAITRRLENNQLVPIKPDYVFQTGDQLLIVTDSATLEKVVDLIGRRSEEPMVMDVDHQRQQVIVTARSMLEKPLGELKLLKNYGVTVSRINRQEQSFVPNATTILHKADQLTVVGHAEHLREFAKVAGHNPRVLEITDIYSLGVGIMFGIALGMVQLPLPGGGSFSLGMAGGPLLVGLLLSHFGHIGPITGYMPRASRMLLNDVGLVFFLAEAGVEAGSSFVAVLADHGLVLLLVGAVVTMLPMVLAYPLARRLFKMDILSSLGGICGGMTSTPGLGAITGRTDAQAPVVGYTSAYPVALILMTLATQALVSLL